MDVGRTRCQADFGTEVPCPSLSFLLMRKIDGSSPTFWLCGYLTLRTLGKAALLIS